MLSTKTYSDRRNALVASMKGESGLMLFLGNVGSPAQCRDNCYKFRQDSNFLYFYGLDVPGLAAVIDLDNGTQTLYGTDDDIDDIIWNGPQPTVRELGSAAGVENAAPYARLASDLKGRKVHFAPVTGYWNMMEMAALTGLNPREVVRVGKAGCKAASERMVRAIIALRLIKSEEEIALLDEACALGQEMHRIGRAGVKIGAVEQDIVGAMEGYALAKGWGVSFGTILTQHGEIFHCSSHAQKVQPGKLMVIDAGVESNDHYASDFTRTYPTGGRFTQKQRDIYQIVCDCNDYAFSLTGPGVAYRDVHIEVARKMLSGLADLGLVHGDVQEMVAEGVCGLFMPHGLGHNMGLDDHDMEDLGEDLVGYDDGQTRSPQLGLGSLRMARRLVPGNVISDEPGIYFIPALIEKWRSGGIHRDFVNFGKLREYYDFGGIRLEDDVLVTPDGARRLGGPRLPITPDEVEQAMEAD